MRTLGPRPAAGLIAGLIAGGLVLAGCGGSPEPKPLPAPTKSSSPSTSASSTPAPPVMPEAAKASSDAAVEAFARHYVDVINFATSTGVLTDLNALAADRCTSCQRLSKRLEEIYTDGGSIQSDGWRVTGAEVLANQPLQRKYVDLAILQSPQILIESTGTKPKKFPGGKQALTMLIARQGSGWIVTRMTLAG